MMTPQDHPRFERRRFDSTGVRTTISAALQTLKWQSLHVEGEQDAVLITACSICSALWESYDRVNFSDQITSDEQRDAILDDLWKEAEPLIAQLSDLHASTVKGHRARATLYLAWFSGELLANASMDHNEPSRLALSLIIDLLESTAPDDKRGGPSVRGRKEAVSSGGHVLPDMTDREIKSGSRHLMTSSMETEFPQQSMLKTIIGYVSNTVRKWF